MALQLKSDIYIWQRLDVHEADSVWLLSEIGMSVWLDEELDDCNDNEGDDSWIV